MYVLHRGYTKEKIDVSVNDVKNVILFSKAQQ